MQVPDRLGDHLAVAVQVSWPLFRGAQHAPDVARHRRFFRQDGHTGAFRIRAAHVVMVTCSKPCGAGPDLTTRVPPGPGSGAFT
jgi:hypothetical protein